MSFPDIFNSMTKRAVHDSIFLEAQGVQKKKDFFCFTIETVITFFLLIYVGFVSLNCDSCIIWDALQNNFSIFQHGVLDIGTHDLK